jgi:uncharacterized protein (TIGR00297 family)
MKHIANFAQMRIKGLSSSGTLAAIAVGAGCAAAGWKWLALLLVFYISSTMLSRYRRESKRLRSRDIVEKSGDRDMWQVAANGGVFAALALASVFHPAQGWYVAAVGALAASTADTWSTEIGMLARQLRDRLCLSAAYRPVRRVGSLSRDSLAVSQARS